MIIEIDRFELIDTDVDLVALDEECQHRAHLERRGLLRRTTATDNERVVVISILSDDSGDYVDDALAALIRPGTRSTERFRTLD